MYYYRDDCFDEIMRYIFRYDYELPELDDIYDDIDFGDPYYQEDIEEFNSIINEIKPYIKDFKNNFIQTYYCVDDNTDYLQLSDNHTWWEIENPNVTEEDFAALAEDYVLDFQNKYNTELYILGRSGRHICVDFDEDNLLRYYDMQKTWNEYEQEFINTLNNKNIYD